MAELGRVADPGALDACEGARARLQIEVPASWLAEGVALEIAAPRRLSCARCEGGGCDTCARSGALRAPEDPAARSLRATVPARGAAASGLALRVPAPFGDDHPIAQIILEIQPGVAASPGVRRLDPPPAPAPLLARHAAVAAAVIALVTIAAALLSR